jgi:Fe-S-cluster containining protein
MTEKNDIIAVYNKDPDNPPPFVMTESARMLLGSIENLLGELVNQADLRPSDDEFYHKFLSIFDLYNRFQHEVINASGINTVCGAGCSHCCCHWVEDVNSFEGIIISRYLAEHHPELVYSIIESFRKDEAVLESLCGLVDKKVAEYSSFTDDIPDKYDLLLSCFYQMQRPCALLDKNGRCIVYPVRPLTCRDYLNVRDPDACLPDLINEEKEATLIMDISDKVSELLEILHQRFDYGDDNMSLRSLLIRCLEISIKSSE